MMTEPRRELTPEEQERGERVMRRCDAFSLLRVVLDDAAARGDIPNTDVLENASRELRVLEEDASAALTSFRREHGIPEPGERS